MASPTNGTLSTNPSGSSSGNGVPSPYQNGGYSGNSGAGGRHGLPIHLNITGNGSAAIYYFDRPGTYNVWLGQNGAPRGAEYEQPRRQDAGTQMGDISGQPRNVSRIPVLKR